MFAAFVSCSRDRCLQTNPSHLLAPKLPKGWLRYFWACFIYFTLHLALAQVGLSAVQFWGSPLVKMILQAEKDQQTQETTGYRSLWSEYEAETYKNHPWLTQNGGRSKPHLDGDHGVDLLSSPTCLQLHRDGLHDLQAVLVKGVERLVPHDVRLQDVATATTEHEERLVQLHRFVCGHGDRVALSCGAQRPPQGHGQQVLPLQRPY